MEGIRINLSAPNLISICIDKVNCGEGMGRLYHKYSPEAILFYDTSQMLMEMEKLYDRLGYPQSTTLSRSFQKSDGEKTCRGDGAKMAENNQVTEQAGEKATFVVHVKYRQNATWQGSVTWAEEQKTCNFRSALELLKLIDGALDSTTGTKNDDSNKGLTE
ncbi:MAG: hypothetical protein RR366_07480 [Clostridium sp.]